MCLYCCPVGSLYLHTHTHREIWMLGLCESRAAWVAERRVGGEQMTRERKAGGKKREEGQKILFVREKELVRVHEQESLCACLYCLSGAYSHWIFQRDDGCVEIA